MSKFELNGNERFCIGVGWCSWLTRLHSGNGVRPRWISMRIVGARDVRERFLFAALDDGMHHMQQCIYLFVLINGKGVHYARLYK